MASPRIPLDPISERIGRHRRPAGHAGRAASAGLGGNAVDAAIATNAAIAVTAPHLCGMGGDLFALVHRDGRGVRAQRHRPRGGRRRRRQPARRGPHRDAVPPRHPHGHGAGMRRRLDARCTSASADCRWRRPRAGDRTSPSNGFPASRRCSSAPAHVLDERGQRQPRRAGQRRLSRPGDRVRRAGCRARRCRHRRRWPRTRSTCGEFGEGLIDARRRLVQRRRPHDARSPNGSTPLTRPHVRRRRCTRMPPNSQGYLLLGCGRRWLVRARPAGRSRRRAVARTC